jgi:hypothetical protein
MPIPREARCEEEQEVCLHSRLSEGAEQAVDELEDDPH